MSGCCPLLLWLQASWGPFEGRGGREWLWPAPLGESVCGPFILSVFILLLQVAILGEGLDRIFISFPRGALSGRGLH